MQNIIGIVKEYLTIQGKYDSGKNYTWEMAYYDVRKLTDKAYELSKRCRTPENRFIARAIYYEIKEEQERLYCMAFNYKAAEKEN